LNQPSTYNCKLQKTCKKQQIYAAICNHERFPGKGMLQKHDLADMRGFGIVRARLIWQGEVDMASCATQRVFNPMRSQQV